MKKARVKAARHRKIILWMLDQTFGMLRYDDAGDKANASVLGIDLMPAARRALDQLGRKGWSSVLLTPSNMPAKGLPVIKNYLPELWQVLPMSKAARRSFSAYSRLVPREASQMLFVGADAVMRKTAKQAGFTVLPHPALALLAAQGDELCLVRMRGNNDAMSRVRDIVPYYSEALEKGERHIIAAISKPRIADAVKLRLTVELLPFDFASEDLAHLLLDQRNDKALAGLKHCRILQAGSQRLLVALAAGADVQALTAGQAHGAMQYLAPNPELLLPVPDAKYRVERAMGYWPLEQARLEQVELEFDFPHVRWICPAAAGELQSDVDRYTGVSNLDSAGTVESRHVQHSDNSRVVDALIADLRAMGYCAYRHEFSYGGQILHNVVADLPGTGYYIIDPPYIELLREIFIRHPLPDPPEPWLEPVREILGNNWFKKNKKQLATPQLARAYLEQMFQLYPWYPWWKCLCRLPGIGSQLVIVGAHLDSSASYEPGYNPATDPAPGADDNASGMAVALAIARYLADYHGKLRHTVRFCFFNAEEVGLVGSHAYAAMLKANNAPVKAAVCCDMLGYNSDLQRIFEIHAGYTDAGVRDISVPIADNIASWAATLGALQPAQIYKGTQVYGGTDRDLYDGAINRSDHASFHQQGYPAVLVSEDFFANLATEPGNDPNPNYHTASDTVIDSSYVADIACAVAFAVKGLAR